MIFFADFWDIVNVAVRSFPPACVCEIRLMASMLHLTDFSGCRRFFTNDSTSLSSFGDQRLYSGLRLKRKGVEDGGAKNAV